MTLKELFAGLVALLCISLGLFLLEAPRAGLEIAPLAAGDTPATVMRVPGAQAPVVVIAHGYAGSRQRLQPVQLTLARAGYITVGFDFEGHGRNPVPMAADAGAPETVARQVDEIGRVIEAALALPGADGRVALLGQAMGSDAAVRRARSDTRVDAVVALSLQSDAVSEAEPANLLIVNGAWEWRARAATRRVMAALGVAEGDTLGTPGEGVVRRAVAAPLTGRVGVPYSGAALREIRAWLNAGFGRSAENGIAATGGPILLVLLGIVLLAQPLAQVFPPGPRVNAVPPGAFWAMAVTPALLAPLVLRLVDTSILADPVADYLALHLAVYGTLVLVGLAVEGDAPGLRGWWMAPVVAAFAILGFGGVLDRYVTSFVPGAGQWPVLGVILPGAVLAMIGDAALIQAGQAAAWRRWIARLAFLGSLALAAALNPDRLSFLLVLLLPLALFFAGFGTIAGWVGRRTGSVAAMGLGLGLVLAWSLANSLPVQEIVP